MERERSHGHLTADDIVRRALYRGATLAQRELPCPWWKDTVSTFSPHFSDYSRLVRDESPEAVAKAEAQWAKSVEYEIPGFAICPFPHMFMVRIPNGWGSPDAMPEGEWEAVGAIPADVAGDRRKWDSFAFVALNHDTSDYSQGWNYATVANKVAPGKEPDPRGMPNPRLYWPNGRLAYMPTNDEVRIGPWLEHLFRRTLEHLWVDATMRNKRTETLRAFLDHHLTRGDAPERFIEYVESLVKGQPAEFDPFLVEKLGAWVEDARTAARAVFPTEHPEPTFTALWGAANVEAVRAAMTARSIAYVTDGKGKERVLAALHAGCDKFGKHPKRLKHWQPMLKEFFPGSTWSEKNKPKDLDSCSDRYKAAYNAILSSLSQ